MNNVHNSAANLLKRDLVHLTMPQGTFFQAGHARVVAHLQPHRPSEEQLKSMPDSRQG